MEAALHLDALARSEPRGEAAGTASEDGLLLEQRDVDAALGEHGGRRHAGDAATDDDGSRSARHARHRARAGKQKGLRAQPTHQVPGGSRTRSGSSRHALGRWGAGRRSAAGSARAATSAARASRGQLAAPRDDGAPGQRVASLGTHAVADARVHAACRADRERAAWREVEEARVARAIVGVGAIEERRGGSRHGRDGGRGKRLTQRAAQRGEAAPQPTARPAGTGVRAPSPRARRARCW